MPYIKLQILFVSSSALEHNTDIDRGEQAESSTWAAGVLILVILLQKKEKYSSNDKLLNV